MDDSQLSALLERVELETIASGGTDWFLSEIVELGELGFSPRIILVVGGSYIAGRLVSAQQYFSALAASFEIVDVPENSILKTVISRMREHSINISRGEDEELGQARRYIHLSDARFVSIDGLTMPSNGVDLRIKLKSVDGFLFGRPQPSSDNF